MYPQITSPRKLPIMVVHRPTQGPNLAPKKKGTTREQPMISPTQVGPNQFGMMELYRGELELEEITFQSTRTEREVATPKMVIPASVVRTQLFQEALALGLEGIAATCWRCTSSVWLAGVAASVGCEVASAARTVEAVSLSWDASTVGSSSLGTSERAEDTLGSSTESSSSLGNDMATVGSVLSCGSNGERASAEMA